MAKKTFEQITQADKRLKGVVSLADKPNNNAAYGEGGLSSTDLKLAFDRLSSYLADKINALYTALAGNDAQDYIAVNNLGATITCLSDLTNGLTDGSFANVMQGYHNALDVGDSTKLATLQAVINAKAVAIANAVSALDAYKTLLASNVGTENIGIADSYNGATKKLSDLVADISNGTMATKLLINGCLGLETVTKDTSVTKTVKAFADLIIGALQAENGSVLLEKINDLYATRYTKVEIDNKVSDLNTAIAAKISNTEKGANNGVAQLGADGKVPAGQLPSYVDDIIECYPRSGKTPSNYDWLSLTSGGAAIEPSKGKVYIIVDPNSSQYYHSQFRYTGTTPTNGQFATIATADKIWIRYASNTSGAGMSSTWVSGLAYFGIYVGATASSNAMDYEWAKFTGKGLTSIALSGLTVNFTFDDGSTQSVTIQTETADVGEINVVNAIVENGTDVPTNGAVYAELAEKQDKMLKVELILPNAANSFTISDLDLATDKEYEFVFITKAVSGQALITATVNDVNSGYVRSSLYGNSFAGVNYGYANGSQMIDCGAVRSTGYTYQIWRFSIFNDVIFYKLFSNDYLTEGSYTDVISGAIPASNMTSITFNTASGFIANSRLSIYKRG